MSLLVGFLVQPCQQVFYYKIRGSYMREIDRAFLAIFKDLKISLNKNIPGTDDNPNYICYIGKNAISNAEVVRMVKRYQDAIIKMLTEEGVAE
jgi:hypothetical protein